ncbi:hypothetical protein [Leifsonia sp. NCR5]|uniref:Sec-independent protein translocase subunit TatA/TatB n=1 Tax=Leifsonia sp. NCR5 TaxID=1978342 RepID=UPI000A190071|nr:hypothetical protein [Leifsonia sp. NCR5]
MFGLTFDKLIVVGVIAAFLVGPARLPGYAAKLGELVRRLRTTADGLKERVADEVGQDIDWQKLDPRRYDPRAIVRSALFDDEQQTPPARAAEPD